MDVRGKLIDLADVEMNAGHALARELKCLMVCDGAGYRVLTAGEGAIDPSSYPGGQPDVDDYLLGRQIKTGGASGFAIDATALGIAQNWNSTGWSAAFGLFRKSGGTDWLAFLGQRKADDSAFWWNFYRQGYGATNAWRLSFNGNGQGGGCNQVPGLTADEYKVNTFTTAASAGAQNGRAYHDGTLYQNESYYYPGNDFSGGGKLIVGIDQVGTPTSGNLVAFFPWFGFWGRQIDDDETLALNDILFDDSADALLLIAKPRLWFFLPGGLSLAIADATHAQAADGLVLTQDHMLALQDALQAQAADNLALMQDHYLAVDDAAHAQAADNLTLAPGEVSLAIAEAWHAQLADHITLSGLGEAWPLLRGLVPAIGGLIGPLGR